MDQKTIVELLNSEITRINQCDLVECIRDHLVTPRVENREWDYGEPGLTYPCWIVLEDTESNIGIAYCELGFGPGYPWGLLFTKGPYTNMGPDSSWYSNLEDAVRNSTFWNGKNPSGYETN